MKREQNVVTAVPPTPAEVRAASTEWRRVGLFRRLARTSDPTASGGGSA
jgi:hypothetical protein